MRASPSGAQGGRIEIGLGGDRTGLRGQTLREQLEHLQDLMTAYDPTAKIEFLEFKPSPDQPEKEARVASDLGMPIKQFTDLYVIGGNNERPDALIALKANLEIARAAGTMDRLNLQVFGDHHSPSLEGLVRFYVEAEELAAKFGIELHTETHIDRFTYDPRRFLEVHEALLNRTDNRLGLRVTAHLSHYVHQIGNSKMSNWEAIRSGALRMNPFDPENIVTRKIIDGGLVSYGHMRMAVPNDWGRQEGTIQYPLVDPRLDTLVQPNAQASLRSGPFDASRHRPWKEWYRQIFTSQLRHPERPVARFSTEFIDGLQPGLYRVDDYSNLFQNIAMVSWAQKYVAQLRLEMT